MKRYFALIVGMLTLSMMATAGDFRAHLAGTTLDVYIGESVGAPADIPDAPAPSNCLIVSVKTNDAEAVAVMVRVMVRLDDQTRIAPNAVKLRLGDGHIVFRFPLGERRVIELIDIHVDNLHKTFNDAISVAY